MYGRWSISCYLNVSIKISVAGSIIITLSLIFYTEKYLRKIFKKDGSRKL